MLLRFGSKSQVVVSNMGRDFTRGAEDVGGGQQGGVSSLLSHKAQRFEIPLNVSWITNSHAWILPRNKVLVPRNWHFLLFNQRLFHGREGSSHLPAAPLPCPFPWKWGIKCKPHPGATTRLARVSPFVIPWLKKN